MVTRRSCFPSARGLLPRPAHVLPVSIALALVLALTGAASTGVAIAQESGQAASTEKRSEPAPEPAKTIAVGDVGVESQRARRQLEDIAATLGPSPAAEAAAKAIPGLTRQVALQVQRSEAVRASSPSVPAIDRLQREWTDLREALTTTQTALRHRGGEIDTQVATARAIRELWAATRARALELEVDPEVIGQIDEVLKRTESVISDATRRQAEVLRLQSEVAALSETTESDLSKIAKVRNQAVGQVLHRDSEPIWSADFWRTVDPGRLAEQISVQEERDRAVVDEYWRHHRERIFVYGALSAFLVVLIYSARRRIEERVSGDAALAPVQAIFRRPIALSVLVAFFGSVWVFSELARSFEPVFAAATLVPAVLVLRQILDEPLLPMLNVAMAVVFAHYFHETIADAVVLSRLIFTVEMGALAAYSVHALRPARLASVPPEMLRTPLFRAVGFGLRASLLLSSITFLSLVAGYGALANLVGGALVLALYAAIVLYGTFRVLDGLIALLIRIRPLRLLRMVRMHPWLIRQRIRLVLQIGAWFIWARATLRRAELWDDVESAWSTLLDAELPFPQISITVGDIVGAVFVFWLALMVSRFIRFALTEDVFSRMTLARGRPYAITTLLHYGVLILGLVLAAAALGFDANRATLLTGAFGVGIGFGLQTIVNNFISGVILLTERPIQVGDTIAMADVFGEVQRIGIRSSTVRTWQGAEVIVPNAELISQQVTNWTLSDRRRRIEIPVGVAYGSQPERVIEVLLSAVDGIDGVLTDPAPVVLFNGFGDSSLDFEVRVWTDHFDRFMSIRSEICVAIERVLGDADIVIPFPQRDLHVKSVDAEAFRAAGATGGDGDERDTGATPLRPTGEDPRG